MNEKTKTDLMLEEQVRQQLLGMNLPDYINGCPIIWDRRPIVTLMKEQGMYNEPSKAWMPQQQVPSRSTGESPATRDNEIPRLLKELEEVLGEMRGNIENLGHRLASVMRQEPAQPCGEKPREECCTSLGVKLNEFIHILRSHSMRVYDVTRLVEL